MKSIALTKLSLAAPPKLRDLVLDPAQRARGPCYLLRPAGSAPTRRPGRTAIGRLLNGLVGLAAALPLTELLCLPEGNQDEENAQRWLDGLPRRRDRTRSMLGRLLKELKEGQDFAGLIRLHQADIPQWLPVLARRALKHGAGATLCMSREPLLLLTVEPAGEIRCFSPDQAVLQRVAELALMAGLESAEMTPAQQPSEGAT